MPVTEGEIKEKHDNPRSSEAQFCLIALREEQAKWTATLQSSQSSRQRLLDLHAHLNQVETLITTLPEKEKNIEPFLGLLKGIKSLRRSLSQVGVFDFFYAQKNHLLAQFFHQLDQVLKSSEEALPSEPAPEPPQADAAPISSITELAGNRIGAVLAATPDATRLASAKVIVPDPDKDEVMSLPEEQRSAALARKLPEVQVLMEHLLSPEFSEWVEAMEALLEAEVTLKEKAEREGLVSEEYLNKESKPNLIAWEPSEPAKRSLEDIKSILRIVKSVKNQEVPLSDIPTEIAEWDKRVCSAKEILKLNSAKRGEEMKKSLAESIIWIMPPLIIHTKFLLEALPNEVPQLAADIEDYKRRHYPDYNPESPRMENAALRGFVSWKYHGNPPLYSRSEDFSLMKSTTLLKMELTKADLAPEVMRAAEVGTVLRIHKLFPTDKNMDAFYVAMPHLEGAPEEAPQE